MKKIYACIFLILLFSCLFSINLFANNTTISLDIYEIVVDCDKNGSFYVDGEKYTGTQSFFRAKGGQIAVELKPNKNCVIKSIVCDTSKSIVIGNNSVIINDIQDNVRIEGEFKMLLEDYGAVNIPCDGGIACPIKQFLDIDTTKWYHEDLDYVVEQGLMNGVSPSRFQPNESTTRSMVVTTLYRLEGSPTPKNESLFIDVEDDTWYTNAILWASENNIVEGYGNNRFGPEDNVTREQMVTILYRYAKYKNYNVNRNNVNLYLEFNDVDQLSDWAFEAMRWACYEEIIKGADRMLIPQSYTERCQIAAILHRFCITRWSMVYYIFLC